MTNHKNWEPNFPCTNVIQLQFEERFSVIPEDNMLCVDLSPSSSDVFNYATEKPFNIFYLCNDENYESTKIRITYYEPNDGGEKKVGYEDEIYVYPY